MIRFLPVPIREATTSLCQLLQRVKRLFGTKRVKYQIATVLDLILIILILVSARQPAQRLMSPLVSSLHSFYSGTRNKTTSETFAFVPDLAPNKFPSIDLDGLTQLSFFDVPIMENGEINRSSRGYQSFTSDYTSELLDRARSQKIKIFLTLSAMDENLIKNLLDNPDAQQRLADGTIDEIRNSNIDGITIDFEFRNHGGKDYQQKFSDFIALLNNKIKNTLPQAQVAVALPSSSVDNNSLYNVENLSKNSDRLFLIASNFIVPEVKNSTPSNPVFGYNENEYWTSVSNLLSNLFKRISSDKLVMERAWYGNGDNYPLYVPKGSSGTGPNAGEPTQVLLNQDTIERLVAGVPGKGKEAARATIPLIAKALASEGILDSNVLAYALATVEHETDETFQPIEEIQGRVSARRRGYEGGTNYFGRGFIQITHLRNYRQIGERIGMGDSLVKNPDLALDPEVSAKILAAFFKDNNVANLASRGDFVDARTPINPDYNGYSVAQLAMKYETN